MKFHVQIIPHTLLFKQPAGTSRGVYTERKVWYIQLTLPNVSDKTGVGECAPLPKLSCDDVCDYEEILHSFARQIDTDWLDNSIPVNTIEKLRPYPSILAGIECALWHFKAGSTRFWNTPFSRGEAGIPINGLIWMGTFEEMFSRIEDKIRLGFRCIKLKIGAINFEDELVLLRHIRKHYSQEQIELRVDANGAFSPEEALSRLQQLAELDLHSIEQPIKAGQWNDMAQLCKSSPLPIALDEELIGINTLEEKWQLLDTIRPAYIILKPSLHDGFYGSDEWITLAQERNIGWWATSALESNVGLNAIAQWCATKQLQMPQGLGTGGLFVENIPSPLVLENDCLWYREK